ncbi:MAG: hypothetical protein HKN72_01820 [Gemmatimonadetes bacterium]|nr:hypothetical protein [Gemmatimonadota bacterium]NNL31078.1 hypothetical protein [Gemmatimonadota bacterium]
MTRPSEQACPVETGQGVPSLSAVASNPRLPLPARTRIVTELSDDLRALRRRLVAQGLPPEEADRRAAEVLVPTGPALRELEDLARPYYLRLVAPFAPERLRMVERWVLVLATVLLLAVEGATLLGAGLLSNPSLYLWPVLAAGTAMLAIVLAKAFQLWIKGAHEHPRRGVTSIAVLAGLTLSIGSAGVVLGLLELAMAVEAAPGRAVELTISWLFRDAALLSTAIILAVMGGLGWLALDSWITWVEQAHAEALDHPNHSTKESS